MSGDEKKVPAEPGSGVTVTVDDARRDDIDAAINGEEAVRNARTEAEP